MILSLNNGRQTAATWLSATLLSSIAVLHVYWAAGGRWPGTDDATLAHTIIGDQLTLPSTAATLTVAFLLTGAAGLLVLNAVPLTARPAALKWMRSALWSVAAVLTARALGGWITSGLAMSAGSSVPYFRLDVQLYSPLCLGLAALIGLALKRPRDQA